MMDSNDRRPHSFWWIPLLVFSSLALGFWGARLVMQRQMEEKGDVAPFYSAGGSNLEAVMEFIKEYYVDTISASRLEDKALASLLRQLDPHSEYIPPSHFKMVNEPLEGNFEGIGVEFNIIHDTVRVIQVIPGGPSEKAGLQAGDRIVKADTIRLTGSTLTNEKVFKALRGKGGTKVKVYIKRSGEKDLLEFLIIRDKIPLHSLESAFIISPGIGYMRFRQFSATTSDEFREVINKLSREGMRKLILDLRGNGGGFLNAAVEMADEFLPKGMRVVYTEGRKYPKKEYFATEYGSFENGELVVLVDENSASASEIVAGALQDNDRAYVLGRRTFGKGLVQDQIPLRNGGAIRLTIARYYTPSGRCIQKPYKMDDHYNYFMEELERYNDGELFHQDSVRLDTTQKFKTPSGRTVYGGGGIMPDIFIPLDTGRFHPAVNRWYRTGRIQQFCFDFADEHRAGLKKKYTSVKDFIKKFPESEWMIDLWFKKSLEDGGKYASNMKVREGLKFIFHAQMGRLLFGDEAFYPLWTSNDRDVLKALELLSDKAECRFDRNHKLVKNSR
ncbi:MAG: S41 family peptidase [Bacteroidia bacterium]|nr:S41 family peptidase [Bacteroidia bacterium]